MSKIRAICILGATGSGKTTCAIELANRLHGEIISVDSAMIYQGMDIGTAKPKPSELIDPQHHLINICQPWERYSVGQFICDAQAMIKDINQRGKQVILTGGTMMYFYALEHGLTPLPKAHAKNCQAIVEKARTLGWKHLHQWLAQVDPVTAAKIAPCDTQRITRALDVFEQTGRPLSQCQMTSERLKRLDIQYVNLVLYLRERADRHLRLAQRFDTMLEQGLAFEVKKLYQKVQDETLPALRCVGYRQALPYLRAEIDAATWRERVMIATRQLAKRQLTWLRRHWAQEPWFDTTDKLPIDAMMRYLKHHLVA